jgi:hypothetical protein
MSVNMKVTVPPIRPDVFTVANIGAAARWCRPRSTLSTVMAQRRDRPALQTSGQAFQVRLPDGRTLGMPGAQAGVCCFCGLELGGDGAERVLLSARWQSGEEEHTQSWSAHRTCLADRLPSFGG